MTAQPKLGVLAGNGVLPANIIDHCLATGRDFFVIAFEGHTNPAILKPRRGAGVPHAWVRLGAAGAAIRILRKNGVEELVMAGGIRRPSFASLRPDLWTARFLLRAGVDSRGDDAVLSAIVSALEGEGFRVVGADDVLPEVLASDGIYGAVSPDDQALGDIALGIEAARGIGAEDIGQAAIVRRGQIVALETAAGTDAMLADCATNRPSERAGVLVKVKKPGQERRADLPTIGVKTIEAADRAGLAGVAIEAFGSLVLDREAVIAAADAAGLFIMGVATDKANGTR